jgi:hypothetical protein
MRDVAMEESEGYGEEEMYRELATAYGDAYVQQLTGGAKQKAPGFVVTIEGYSPYRRIGDLLDPPNVKDNQKQWGFLTRLEYLKKFLNLDVNSPYAIYPTDSATGVALKEAPHYKLETGPVDLDTDIPKGVGEWLFTPDPPAPGTMQTGAAAFGAGYGAGMAQQTGTWTLIDPMTKELISADPVKDARGSILYDATNKAKKTIHDYWFKLQFKILWNEAPKSAAPAAGAAAPGGAAGSRRR